MFANFTFTSFPPSLEKKGGEKEKRKEKKNVCVTTSTSTPNLLKRSVWHLSSFQKKERCIDLAGPAAPPRNWIPAENTHTN